MVKKGKIKKEGKEKYTHLQLRDSRGEEIDQEGVHNRQEEGEDVAENYFENEGNMLGEGHNPGEGNYDWDTQV